VAFFLSRVNSCSLGHRHFTLCGNDTDSSYLPFRLSEPSLARRTFPFLSGAPSFRPFRDPLSRQICLFLFFRPRRIPLTGLFRRDTEIGRTLFPQKSDLPLPSAQRDLVFFSLPNSEAFFFYPELCPSSRRCAGSPFDPLFTFPAIPPSLAPQFLIHRGSPCLPRWVLEILGQLLPHSSTSIHPSLPFSIR